MFTYKICISTAIISALGSSQLSTPKKKRSMCKMSGDEGTVYDFTLTTKLAKARMYDDFAEIKGPEWPFGHFLFEH